jgi:hypothetical protein
LLSHLILFKLFWAYLKWTNIYIYINVYYVGIYENKRNKKRRKEIKKRNGRLAHSPEPALSSPSLYHCYRWAACIISSTPPSISTTIPFPYSRHMDLGNRLSLTPLQTPAHPLDPPPNQPRSSLPHARAASLPHRPAAHINAIVHASPVHLVVRAGLLANAVVRALSSHALAIFVEL